MEVEPGVPVLDDDKSKGKDALVRIIKFRLDEYLKSSNPDYKTGDFSKPEVNGWDEATLALFNQEYDLGKLTERI